MRKGLLAALLVLLPGMGDAQVPGIQYQGPGGGAVTVADKQLVATATGSTSQEALHTLTLPANSLQAVGDYVVIQTIYQTAANGNAKTMRHYYGSLAGTVLCSITGTTGNNNAYVLRTVCHRNGATTAFCSSWFVWTGGNVPGSSGNGLTLTGLDFTAPMNFVASALTATSAGDVTAISSTLLVTKF